MNKKNPRVALLTKAVDAVVELPTVPEWWGELAPLTPMERRVVRQTVKDVREQRALVTP